MSEFAGRTAGALILGEALGLTFAGFGSVVPGLGTTIGALAGGIFGGVLGAGLGETGARALCDSIIHALNSHAGPGKNGERLAAQAPHSTPNAGRGDLSIPPHVLEHKRHAFLNPHVRHLQKMMLRSGYAHPETNFVCKAVTGRLIARHSGGSVTTSQIFESLIPELPPVEPLNAWLDRRVARSFISSARSGSFTGIRRSFSRRRRTRSARQSGRRQRRPSRRR